jgi:hypothetical protein
MQLFRPAKLLTALVLGALLWMGSASTASAGYIWTILDDGVVAASGSTAAGALSFDSGTVLTTNFSLVAGSSLTSGNLVPTVVTLASELKDLKLIGNGTHTVTLELVYQGYVDPVGSPLAAANTASADFTGSSTSDKATFQAWADANNGSTFNSGTTAGQQSANSPGGTATGVVLTPDGATFTFDRTGAYSLKQTLSITLSNGGSSGQVQGTTTITTVPEPASMLIALVGAPMLGAGYLARRRKAKAAV